MRGLVIAGLIAVLAAPGGAWAFSFGTFDPGDSIASITLTAGGGPVIDYDAGSQRLEMAANVTTINMVGGSSFNAISGVSFEAHLDLIPGSVSFNSPSGPTEVDADFNGAASLESFDVRILDNGPGGGGSALLRGDFLDPVVWDAGGNFPFVTGSLDGEFVVTGGDAAFTNALPSGALVDWFMTAFTTPGGPVLQVCDLANSCGSPTTLGDWSSNPSATLTPRSLPEPTTALLLAGGLAGLALVRRRAGL